MFLRFSLNVAGAVCLGMMFGVAAAQEADSGSSAADACGAEAYRQFDFWIGDWEVRNPDGEVVGHNTIERILNGCALRESWRGKQGSVGYSFNTYDQSAGEWHQTWVDANGMLLRLDGGLVNGRMVLRGEMPTRDAGMAKTRIIWTPKDDGTVRQHWEASKDGGKTWETVFDGHYVPEE